MRHKSKVQFSSTSETGRVSHVMILQISNIQATGERATKSFKSTNTNVHGTPETKGAIHLNQRCHPPCQILKSKQDLSQHVECQVILRHTNRIAATLTHVCGQNIEDQQLPPNARQNVNSHIEDTVSPLQWNNVQLNPVAHRA